MSQQLPAIPPGALTTAAASGGGLNHPVPDRRDAQETFTATWLGDHHPPHWRGPLRLQDEFLTQALQPCVRALRFDLCEQHAVHANLPVMQASRHSHLYFRGLLKLYSRYGPPNRLTAQGRST